MSEIHPGLRFGVPNLLLDDGSALEILLSFESMRDFDPSEIVDNVSVLRDLLALRKQLVSLKETLENRSQDADNQERP